jgi:hypothetical protein
MKMITTNGIPFGFIALSIAAPTAALLLLYGSYDWDESVVLGCLFIGFCLWLALFGWSISSIRRYRFRAFAGFLDCAYCLWQLLHAMSKW